MQDLLRTILNVDGVIFLMPLHSVMYIYFMMTSFRKTITDFLFKLQVKVYCTAHNTRLKPNTKAGPCDHCPLERHTEAIIYQNEHKDCSEEVLNSVYNWYIKQSVLE